jgi:hypothetical protein
MISDYFYLISLTLSHQLTDQIYKLVHENGFLAVENEIMEEKIKGIHYFFEHFCGKLSVQEKLSDEVRIVVKSIQKLAVYDEELHEKLEDSTYKQQTVEVDFLNLSKLTEIILAHKERVQKTAIDKIRFLQKEFASSKESEMKLQGSLEECKKRLLETSEELKTLKIRSRKSKVVKSSSDEKFCAICFQVFNDMENFNWSCRTHKSQLTEDRYWCCNGVGKDAPGCIFSKHMTNEELSEQVEDKKYVQFCVGCKTTGHLIKDCFKDPNIQSGPTVLEEVERLKVLSSSKKKQLNQGVELQERAIDLSNRAVSAFAFNRIYDSEDEIEELEGTYFRDLVDIKELLEIPRNKQLEYRKSIHFKKRRFLSKLLD